MRIKYVGPFDEIELPDVGAVVRSGAVLDVADDVGRALLDQRENFAAVDPAAVAYVVTLDQPAADEAKVTAAAAAYENATVAELRAIATKLGVDLGTAKKKQDIVDALTDWELAQNENEEA